MMAATPIYSAGQSFSFENGRIFFGRKNRQDQSQNDDAPQDYTHRWGNLVPKLRDCVVRMFFCHSESALADEVSLRSMT